MNMKIIALAAVVAGSLAGGAAQAAVTGSSGSGSSSAPSVGHGGAGNVDGGYASASCVPRSHNRAAEMRRQGNEGCPRFAPFIRIRFI